MKKLFLLAIVVLLLAGGVSGCKTDVSTERPKPVASEPAKTSNETNKSTEEPKKETGKVKVTTASGTYVGQMDGNSIEVTIDGNPTAFYFSEAVKESFDAKAYKKDAKVEVTFYKNENGQTILNSIEIK